MKFLSWCMLLLAMFAVIKIWEQAPIPWWGVFIPGYPVAVMTLAEIIAFFFRDKRDGQGNKKKKREWDFED